MVESVRARLESPISNGEKAMRVAVTRARVGEAFRRTNQKMVRMVAANMRVDRYVSGWGVPSSSNRIATAAGITKPTRVGGGHVPGLASCRYERVRLGNAGNPSRLTALA